MASYSLWALSEPQGQDLLLVIEQAGGSLADPVYVRDVEGADIRSFLSSHGMPEQIVANLWISVRRLRQADARLFQIPASVLKPKDLAGPLVAIALRAYRTK
jgi:hypothetical protein